MEQKNSAWIIVSIILGISLFASAFVLTQGIKSIRSSGNEISLKGSAKEEIKSDYAVWSGSFSSNNVELQTAYQDLESTAQQVKDFLISKGFSEKDLIFSSVSTMPINAIMQNGMYSNSIESYRLSQTVEIRSDDVDKIAEISRISTELINQGITFESYPPQYFYTKLADKKIHMIEMATLDAKARADAMLKSSGKSAGDLKNASVGVFQITAPYSNEISDYGINDTSSIDKEITAVITCTFEIK